MPLIFPARLVLNADQVPWSEQYGDVYHAAAGAAEQSRHVFLQGNGLPERWQSSGHFVIVETGFGLGLNFLQTCDMFLQASPPATRLHFLSVEKHPFSASALAQAHERAGLANDTSRALCAQWPPLVSGIHRLFFAAGRITLTLGFGDVETVLRDFDAKADAIFLDGFAPSRNPEMWSAEVFRRLAALSDGTTTVATWSVSGAVREGLAHAGFQVQKTTGFADKREMLTGQFRGVVPPAERRTAEKRALVIGAGLAGTGIAERLASRGWKIRILEAQSAVAQGASGNLAGAFRPLPSKDDNPLSRITRAGFLYGLRHINALQAQGKPLLWDGCGVLHLARNAQQELRQRQVVDTLQWPQDFMDWVSAAEATKIAGHTAAFGGWWFPTAGWIQPASLCEANLDSSTITLSTGIHVARIARVGNQWAVYDADNNLIDEAPTLILANAAEAKRLAAAEWLPLQAVRGQVSHLPIAQLAPLHVVVCGQGYITPGIGGHAALGASFVVDDFDLTLREAEHQENLDKLDQMLPGYSHAIDPSQMDGRTSFRPVSIDRLPMVGAMPRSADDTRYKLSTLPREQGLWLITGFGARGLVWSSLCSELLASRICGEPLPLERDLVDAMDPARFVLSPPKHSARTED